MAGDVRPFDRFAPVYDLFMYGANAATLRAGFDYAERPIERVLDVGGGTGRAARALDRETVVVDAARGMLQQAQGKGLPAIQGDASRLPFPDDAVDAVLIVDALHHMGDPDAVLAAARRVLRPGGVLVVREFDPTTLRGRALVAAEHLVGFDSQFFPPDGLVSRLEREGFETAVPDRGFGYTVVGVVRKGTSEDAGGRTHDR